MPSRRDDGPLRDMRRHIDLARSFAGTVAFADFKADRRTVLAVIRCLEVVSEASRRLSNDLKDRHPEIPWADIAGAGNVYRHDYEDVDDRIVWNTVQNGLSNILIVIDEELGV